MLKQLEAHGCECAIASPVWHELIFACQRLPRGRRRDAIETYLEDVVPASFAVLGYDEDAARWHGIERARLEGLDKPAPYADGQIEAIACVHELTLVTANVKDFARLKGVEVENCSSGAAEYALSSAPLNGPGSSRKGRSDLTSCTTPSTNVPTVQRGPCQLQPIVRQLRPHARVCDSRRRKTHQRIDHLPNRVPDHPQA